MNDKIRAIGAGLLAGIWLGLSCVAWFSPPAKMSESERRELTQKPELTLESVMDGSYMDAFGDYTVDQFPSRDAFRSVKALVNYYGLRQLDNNGYFVRDGYIVKQTYPLEQPSVNHATAVMNRIYKTYLAESDCTVYLAVVPDKGYYLATDLGYPAMDYESLFSQLQENLPWAQYVDITDTLSLSNYYKTDTHWKQETLIPTAQALCQAMGVSGPTTGDFAQKTLDTPFYGVYYGHAAVPMKAEQLTILESNILRDCKVYDPVNQCELPMYNLEKLSGKDPYEVYLSGNMPVIEIENPNAQTDKELVIFRDSFGSSIAPLLLQDYSKVTMVDIRYITQRYLSSFVTFENQDVLFLYSTLVLNDSATMNRQ